MVIMSRDFPSLAQRGSTMIEVLVAIVVLTLGLLGLAGLQSRLQVSEMEAYQRSQALILVNDMASRLATNRAGAAAYVAAAPAGSPLGAGMTCPTATGTRAQLDINEWCNALQGAGETLGSSKVGTLVGGRGCIEAVGGGDYKVTVAWQGYVPISARALGGGGAIPACGSGSYAGGTGSPCTGDLCRRLVTTLVRIPTL
jgi:type IV pilus assembly protein PilV